MTVTLNDGTKLNAIQVNGGGRYFQNMQRDTLEFVFSKEEYAFDTLDAYFADENKTQKITLSDGDNSYVHDGYVLRVSMQKAPVVIVPETVKSAQVTEERISVTMAQESYIERQLKALGIAL